MKKMILILAFIISSGFVASKAETNLNLGGPYGLFYTELAPYGTWIQTYDGVVVWRPNFISTSWAPYTDGRWAWTPDGWYWHSYEPFGYIVFHYGRWYYDNYYGWVWVPDNQWAPAWVEWRYDNNYIGWAPLPPYAGFSINIGLHFSLNYVSPYRFWRFVTYRHFCDPYVYHYYVPHNHIYGIYKRTTYRADYGFANGRVVNRGVSIDVVRKRSGQNIRETNVRVVSNPRELRNNPGSRNEIRAFIATREELSRNRSGSMVIQRGRQRSSLDINKIQVDKPDMTPTVKGNENYRTVTPNRSVERNRVEAPRTIQRENPPVRNESYKNDSPVIIKRNPNNQSVERSQPQRNTGREQTIRRSEPQRREAPPSRENRSNPREQRSGNNQRRR